MKIAPTCDAIIVIGSANSSNTRALEKLARDYGCDSVYRINSADELPGQYFRNCRYHSWRLGT